MHGTHSTQVLMFVSEIMMVKVMYLSYDFMSSELKTSMIKLRGFLCKNQQSHVSMELSVLYSWMS